MIDPNEMTVADWQSAEESDRDNPLLSAADRMPPRKYVPVVATECETCGGVLDRSACCYRCEGGM